MSSRPELRLDWCTHEAAKYACLNWHYSKTVPTGKPFRIGAWENGTFVGCIFFGSGASAALGTPYGLTTFQVCELVRVALSKHGNTVTRMISIAIRMLKKENPGLKLVVSFADPFNGHHGGIYQGGNWIYAGDSSPSQSWKLPDGTYAHDRRFSGSGWNAPKKPPIGAVKIRVPGKHRYLMPLDDEMRRRIEPLRKPYPKRVRSEDSGTIGHQPIRGGAIPTRTLLNSLQARKIARNADTPTT
jgi:hypothetical protein